jgi:hypothetical protein
MDSKLFFEEVKLLKSLMAQTKKQNTFSNRYKVKKQRKIVMKIIKRAAQTQADIAYKQAYDLYFNFLTSNL